MATTSFQMPEQIREMAEKNVEQARAAYGQSMDAMTQAMGMWSKGIPEIAQCRM